jgi:hypothetical protein
MLLASLVGHMQSAMPRGISQLQAHTPPFPQWPNCRLLWSD